MWTQDDPEQKGMTEDTKRRPDSRNWERNLAAMAAASLICQAATTVGYTGCVILLTAIAAGAQEYEEREPKENGAVPSVEKEIWNKRCDGTTNHIARLERSLLFLTVTSAVCQMASQKWYGPCVFLLTVLASGDLGVQAEEKGRGTNLREHLLEAYDCDDPEEMIIYPTREQNDQERVLERGEVKNYTIIKRRETFDYEATLCAVRRKRDYYQCMNSLYLGATAPPEISREDN